MNRTTFAFMGRFACSSGDNRRGLAGLENDDGIADTVVVVVDAAAGAEAVFHPP